ncbi:alpha/beta hydrolase [Herbaspirillum rubrisubalbicans]|uniref:Alpha/beta hydrolase n=1 Tax=Herbaspirillum rubrisubalbicans TaxID=80842 RepID=A0AAD0UAH3_9BURK|nr:alpha/beta hydrolase [Herbaspirillum rubrisubalbicans]AYR26327.1 alpha/beta hydrolase [Herbaspirillum rubrisubalbicans]
MRLPPFFHSLLPSVMLAALLAGCTSDPLRHADAISDRSDLQREEVRGGRFLLTSYVHARKRAPLLRVYIEGDGRAWITRSQHSLDPTPITAMGLRLAANDGGDVVYLARPCQFTSMTRNPDCQPAYWTGLRYGSEVVTSMDEALSYYVARLQPDRLELVGYSGGGSIAVLLAARRKDVSAIRTVAGNLDHVAMNRWHEVSQMPRSLNPIDFAAQVAHIPQLHVSGSEDKVIPTAITRTFVARAAPCAALKVVPGMKHESDWGALWPELLQVPLPCAANSSDTRGQ